MFWAHKERSKGPRHTGTILVIVWLTLLGDACKGPEGTPASSPKPPPEHHDVESDATKHWVGPEDSSFDPKAVKDVRPDCLKDYGCPFEPTPIPPCPEDLEPQPVDAVFENAEALLGSEVMVKGKLILVPAGVLRRGCPQGLSPTEREWCLHSCVPAFSGMAISGEHKRFGFHARGFQCAGDTSLQCCGFSTLGEIIARGIVDQPGGWVGEWWLANPKLCALGK